MKKLWKYMKTYKVESVLGPLFKLLEASFELFVPLVVASIVDVGIRGEGGTPYIWRMGLILVALGAIGLICSVTAQYFAAKASVGFATGLRHALFHHIQTFSYENLDKTGTSTIITRMTSDINQVQSGVNLALRLLLRSPFVVFGAMIMAFTIDVRSALIFVVAIPLLCVVVFGIMLISIPLYRRVQKALDGVLGITRENLTGARVIRAFGQEDEQIREFDRRNELLTTIQKLVGRITALLNPITYLIINAAIIWLIYTGAWQVENDILSAGQVLALYNYMSQILVELIKMANLIISMTKAAACANRVSAILDIEPTMSYPEVGKELPAGPASVAFHGVSLTYAGAGAPALSGIDFSVAPGETVGVIGGTGSGKSSLISLIGRFYDVTEGAVTLCGHDVRDLTAEQLQKTVGIVPQKAVLFRGSIRDNMKWGNADATDEEIMAAVSLAQAAEVVEGKEGGLDFVIEQGGRNLSGGQRQRLTIARTLLKRPAVLILDDSASALDYGTDLRLRRAIAGMKDAPTTFIVSQRAASVRQADKIIVLDDGEMVGLGTHDELLQNCPVYQEIYYSQFPEEGAVKA